MPTKPITAEQAKEAVLHKFADAICETSGTGWYWIRQYTEVSTDNLSREFNSRGEAWLDAYHRHCASPPVEAEQAKPCPFCGSSDVKVGFIRDGLQVRCQNQDCGAEGAAAYHGPNNDTEKRALCLWNTRVYAPVEAGKAGEIKRYGQGLDFEGYACKQMEPQKDGRYVLYTDHTAALSAERVKGMQMALEAVRNIQSPHLDHHYAVEDAERAIESLIAKESEK